MRHFRYSIVFALIFIFCTGFCHKLHAMDGLTLAQQVYDRDDGKDSHSVIQMLLIDKGGKKRFRTMITTTKQYGNTIKSLIRFTSPADIEGTSFLTWENEDREDDQFLYLPALKRVRRIVSTQKASRFVNTDYTYEDMERRKPNLDQHHITGEEKLLDLDCWILESIPKTEESSQYGKRKSWIAKDILLPLKVEYYDKKSRMLKELGVVKFKQIDGIWTVIASEMQDLKKKHRTLLRTKTITFNQGVDDSIFTEAYMMHGE